MSEHGVPARAALSDVTGKSSTRRRGEAEKKRESGGNRVSAWVRGGAHSRAGWKAGGSQDWLPHKFGALIVVMLAMAGCSERVHRQATIEEAPQLAATINMGDRSAAGQLVSGFHDNEAGGWRWTERQFAVTLRPPRQAARLGAELELHLSVPQSSIDQLKSLTLTARVGGTALAPETYRKAGDYTYRREIEPGVISGRAARVDFALDHALPPGAADLRELGIVVQSAGMAAR